MITSKDNSLIKLCNQIKQKKYSRENNICLVETTKVVLELYKKNLITHILVVKNKYEIFKDLKNVKIEVISESIANYLSDATTSDGVFAICRIVKADRIDYSRCLILDNIQDPSNIGALIRSATAFGYKTIFAINSVYPYTYKCIRASMGYIFSVNFIETTYEELKVLKNSNNIELISADMDGQCIDLFEKSESNIALVIGNEGQGVSDILLKMSDRKVSIPMKNNVESLNASVSAGILMYLLR